MSANHGDDYCPYCHQAVGHAEDCPHRWCTHSEPCDECKTPCDDSMEVDGA